MGLVFIGGSSFNICLFQQAQLVFPIKISRFQRLLYYTLFEYVALGKPIWASVAGHAASFVRTHLSNAAVFAPCDAEGAVVAFAALDIVDAPRDEFVARFKRTAIMDAMAEDLVATVGKSS